MVALIDEWGISLLILKFSRTLFNYNSFGNVSVWIWCIGLLIFRVNHLVVRFLDLILYFLAIFRLILIIWFIKLFVWILLFFTLRLLFITIIAFIFIIIIIMFVNTIQHIFAEHPIFFPDFKHLLDFQFILWILLA